MHIHESTDFTILAMFLLPFWALTVVFALLPMKGQKALRFHLKYLHLCSEDEQRSCGFETTWGWVINDRILFSFLGVNYPFKRIILTLKCITIIHLYYYLNPRIIHLYPIIFISINCIMCKLCEQFCPLNIWANQHMHHFQISKSS